MDVEDGPKTSAGAILNRAFNQHPVWDTLVGALLERKKIDRGLFELCRLVPGIPVGPMLAKPTRVGRSFCSSPVLPPVVLFLADGCLCILLGWARVSRRYWTNFLRRRLRVK